jgi:hypothetical protein
VIQLLLLVALVRPGRLVFVLRDVRLSIGKSIHRATKAQEPDNPPYLDAVCNITTLAKQPALINKSTKATVSVLPVEQNHT